MIRRARGNRVGNRSGDRRGKTQKSSRGRDKRPKPTFKNREGGRFEVFPEYRNTIKAAKKATSSSLKKWLKESNRLSEIIPSNFDFSNRSVLDPWQKKAFDYLVAGESVIVDAPTTAGKTRIVEAFFEK